MKKSTTVHKEEVRGLEGWWISLSICGEVVYISLCLLLWGIGLLLWEVLVLLSTGVSSALRWILLGLIRSKSKEDIYDT